MTLNNDLSIMPDHARPPISTEDFDLSPVRLVDAAATDETVSLFAFLRGIAGRYIMFGHQNDTTESVVTNAAGGSDTFAAVGAYPAVFGIGVRMNASELIAIAKDIHAKNGIVTLEDHMPNFTSGGSFYDMTPCVEHILPGGKDHAKFVARLDATADFANGFKDDSGKLVPVIYRPFHENSGNWFWWGSTTSTREQYIALWHFTVRYLRDERGVRNFLYAYSPNGHFKDEADYLDRYPGDDFVDLIGMDIYDDRPEYGSGWMEATMLDARILVGIAESRGKVAALTEAGLRWNAEDGLKPSGNTVPDWFSLLHRTLSEDPVASKIAYMLTWRNDNPGDGPPRHFWVPFRGHPVYGDHEMVDEFVKYYNLDTVLFADRLRGQFDLKVRKV
ncbi:hypothetical protein GZH47_02835 [Paenibacillus rhizovicinus]|uniref:GH26 domain-containing protein n=1 Tax=Paenibacillus rhizovicinus TaxID=2704463 RepID=A0A6C0NUI6_9BACL|nr:glycosyl hydrolase [Paenibacillus rhizovicinus]QHW29869.1 hypothetical protein GZH47_02835 [Paenibacillus rhizovicinus]